jgi:hypothetical protein
VRSCPVDRCQVAQAIAADVYGILPTQSNDITVALTFGYLDRPEYAAARQRMAGA